MKLRFQIDQIDQAKLFRKGINAPKSIVTVEIDPASVDEPTRNLIADRMFGIDVYSRAITDPPTGNPDKPELIKADEATFDALVVAVKEDEQRWKKRP